MMPTYPRRESALHASLLAQPGSDYEPDAWQNAAGVWHGAVGYDAGPLWFTIQGSPASLRELAAALTAAADQADQHTAADPATSNPDPEPEGVPA
jgi:hypothetical protein